MVLLPLLACSPGGSDLRPVTTAPPATVETGAPSDTDDTDDGSGATAAAVVVINEFLASNLTGITDASGGRPDWIELYNPGAAEVSLAGFALADSVTPDALTELDPALSVPGGGWIVLFADGAPDAGADHLDFSLASEGGEIGLFRDGDAVDLLRYGPQASDWSAARAPDGADSWGIDDTPTPGAANDGPAAP